METRNYEITIFKGTTGKIVNRHILYGFTMEEAEENAYKSRCHFTYLTETLCFARIKEIKNK